MPSRGLLLSCLLTISTRLLAQKDFTPTAVTTAQVTPPTIYISYTGDLPSDPSVLENATAWEVWWKPLPDAQRTPLQVVGFDQSQSHKLGLQIAGTLPGEDLGTVIWIVHFNPVDKQRFQPDVMTSHPTRGPASGAKSCDGGTRSTKPYLCPPQSGARPDISLAGNFIAAGGTKPIYSFELLAGLYARTPWKWMDDGPRWMHDFRLGLTAAVEINQSPTLPNNRTRFDPDSLIAAFALQKIYPTDKLRSLHVYALQFDQALPAGEFSRADPSSNIIARTGMLVGITPFVPKKHPAVYGTLYPVIALEAGRNLNKPTMISAVPVDLTRYNNIVRGVAGADAALSIATKTDKSDYLSFTASYRVRLPAMDEPLIKTLHQVTTVDLTTRPRHWLEANANYTPWSFKYVSLNAKYQYGVLPPLFTLVDQKFSFGFTLRAVQSRNSHIVDAAK